MRGLRQNRYVLHGIASPVLTGYPAVVCEWLIINSTCAPAARVYERLARLMHLKKRHYAGANALQRQSRIIKSGHGANAIIYGSFMHAWPRRATWHSLLTFRSGFRCLLNSSSESGFRDFTADVSLIAKLPSHDCRTYSMRLSDSLLLSGVIGRPSERLSSAPCASILFAGCFDMETVQHTMKDRRQ
jgi:hypothetical protein